MNLVAMAQKRARLVLATLAFLLATGAFALWAIPKESSPDIQIPTMYVSVNLPGISPEDAVNLLAKPMEQQLSGIDGVKTLKTAGYQGGANAQVEFQAGFDSAKALNDVRSAIDKAKTKFPPNQPTAQQPDIREINLSLFPIISIAVYGDVDERTRLSVARALQDRIELIPEVLSADIVGDRDKQVEIIVSPDKLEGLGIRAEQLLSSLSQSNLLVAAGNVSEGTGDYPVQVPGIITTPEQLYSLPIQINGDRVTTLRDVADVRYNFTRQKSASYTNGQPSLTIQVVKRIGENMLGTIAKTKAVLAEAEEQLPPGVSLEVVGDQSIKIKDFLTDLTNSVVVAVLLVVSVVMALLGGRDGFLVGVSVPGSFLGGLLAIYLSGLTINIVVLFALILSVGMLVDDAIIVSEYAARRIEEGMSKRMAYREAATRMAWPISTATVTKIAAFIPLLFWPGIVGEFMRYMPITLVCVLTASLIFALLILPVLGTELHKVKRIIIYSGCLLILAVGGFVLFKVIGAMVALLVGAVGLLEYTKRNREKFSRLDKEELMKEQRKEWGELQEHIPEDWWHKIYVKLLRGAVKKPLRVVMLSFGLLFATFGIYSVFGHGVNFFPTTEPEQFSLTVSARGNLSIDDKTNLVKRVEEKVLAYKNTYGGIKVVNSLVGSGDGGGFNGGEADIDQVGEVAIEMENWRTRPSADFVLQNLLLSVKDIPGILVRTKKQQAGPAGPKPINFELYAESPDLLRTATYKVVEELNKNKNLTEVSNDLPPPSLNWDIQVDKEVAARYGANVAMVGNYVQMVTQGVRIGDITTNDSDKQVDVVARFPEAYRGISGLDRVKVNTGRGGVPLSYFVEKQAVFDQGVMKRTDQKLTQSFASNVKKGVLANDEIIKIDTWLSDNLPRGVTFAFTGDQELQNQSRIFLMKAFVIAVAMIAAVMLLQFNSFSTCLFILTAVIMSTAGVLIGLLIMGQSFGVVMSGLGVIALSGVIVNNNIVLIDTYDHHRSNNIPALEAVILAGAQRLRPVLLTSACTVLGLLPIAFAVNIDFVNRGIDIGGPSAVLWVQLATAIVFGMIFATPFTLLVTPCMLVARERYFGYVPSQVGVGMEKIWHRVFKRKAHDTMNE